MSEEKNSLILLLKLRILTLYSQYVRFRIVNRSEFAKFWPGTSEEFLETIKEELEETRDFANNLESSKKPESSSFKGQTKFSLILSDLLFSV